ncbi:MAG: hypothetical protein DRZ76_00050 [Candidatus Nealsonbacteria bacterium]|nr:MAG: hypothetical protein DRZ76_00050 [Candidatus Nealsonbacteria bacterium]
MIGLTIGLLTSAHFLGDYFLQKALQKVLKKWEIRYTKSGWQLWGHCLTYLVFFIPIFWFLRLNWAWLFWLFLGHALVDVEIKNFKFKRSYSGNYFQRLLKLDTALFLDQGLHFLFLVPLFFQVISKW